MKKTFIRLQTKCRELAPVWPMHLLAQQATWWRRGQLQPLRIKFLQPACCLLLLLTLLPNSPALAQADSPFDTIILAVDPNSPPFVSETAAGALVGFDIELMKNLARLAGLQVDYQKAPFHYIIPGVATRLFDVAQSCIFINDARKKLVNFTEPYFTTGLVFVVQATQDELHTLADLAPAMTVSVVQATAGEAFAHNQTLAHVQPLASAADALQRLEDQGVTASIVDEMAFLTYMDDHPDASLRLAGFLTKEECALAVNKDEPTVLAQLNLAITRLKNSGQYNILYRKWFGNRPTSFVLPVQTPPPATATALNATPTPTTTALVTATASVTPTHQWAGVYYLTAPPLYQIVTLTADGIWSGAALLQSSAALTASQPLAAVVNQQGVWQADATGQITATVLSFPPTVTNTTAGLHRLTYQMTIDEQGLVAGSYTEQAYPLGENPWSATTTITATQTISFTGQRVKP